MSSVLANARKNQLLVVEYGDKPTARVVRVQDVRDTNRDPISVASIQRRPNVFRGRYLVTCQDTDGQIRSFYSGGERDARKLGPIRTMVLYLKGKLPARV